MKKDFVIVRPKEEYVDQIRELRLEALKESPLAFGSSYDEEIERSEEEWKEYILRPLINDYIYAQYAKMDGKIVGSIGAYIEPLEKTAHIAYTTGFYVTKGLQGEGIGPLLLDVLIEKLSQRPGIRKLQLQVAVTQEPAIKLYKDKGFVEVGRLKDDIHYDGEFYDALIMEKYL